MSLLPAVKARGRRVAQPVPVPAPTGGWNVRDAYSGMDPRFAIRMDNWFPESACVCLRKGYKEHATGLGDTADTLFGHDFEGTQALVACTTTKIIDVTSAVTSDLATGLTNGYWSHTQSGGFTIMVNGADTPRKFDGATVSTTVFTGTTATDLYGVHNHKNRLYLWKNNATSFWYGGVDAIAGAISEFDLQYVHNFRGKIVAMGSWTFDGGAGVDDVLAIFTSHGQVFAYSGSDPGDATDWSLVGVFDLGGHPLGRRSVAQYGGDLIVITENGYFPLSKALTLGSVSTAITVSDVINGAVDAISTTEADNDYWQIYLRGSASMLIVNVPSIEAPGTYEQHVMNTRTGAWCRFTGMNALTWGELGDSLYFAAQDENTIFQADTGQNDDGADIEGRVDQAFSHLGDKTALKRWTMVRPVLQSDDATAFTVGLAMDYGEPPGFAAVSSTATEGVEWDSAEATWDVAEWASEGIIKRDWQAVSGLGYAASVVLKVSTQSAAPAWYETTHLVEPGGVM